MIFEYIDTSNTRKTISLDNKYNKEDGWYYLQTESKLEFIEKFIALYKSRQKIVLFDPKHKQLLDFYTQNNINEFMGIENLSLDTKLLFFTSGSSGFPVGAFKTKQNLENEVKSLCEVLSQRSIKKVIVTVPFVHIYGILVGLLLPLELRDITLVVKEDFLPYEIIEETKDGNCLVVTTPVFIKALAKLSENKPIENSLFISSTAPLSREDVVVFHEKYNCDVMQLFGSTETGGIAYKFNDNIIWKPLKGVDIATKDNKLNVVSPFVSEYLLTNCIQKIPQPYQTEDIVTIQEDGFILLGRSNKLIKIAGKRISALQIEKILEEIPEVTKAIVELVYKKELLRSEQIVITLETSQKIDKKVLKEKISEYYGVITIPFQVKYVDKINYSSMGKKVVFS